jgi:hypothetical protein
LAERLFVLSILQVVVTSRRTCESRIQYELACRDAWCMHVVSSLVHVLCAFESVVPAQTTGKILCEYTLEQVPRQALSARRLLNTSYSVLSTSSSLHYEPRTAVVAQFTHFGELKHIYLMRVFCITRTKVPREKWFTPSFFRPPVFVRSQPTKCLSVHRRFKM